MNIEQRSGARVVLTAPVAVQRVFQLILTYNLIWLRGPFRFSFIPSYFLLTLTKWIIIKVKNISNMYSLIFKHCVQPNMRLGRKYGIVTSIHLLKNNNNNNNNDNNHVTLSKSLNYEVKMASLHSIVSYFSNT